MTPRTLLDSVPVRLGAFAVVLVVVFVVAFGVGSAVGPVDGAEPTPTTATDEVHDREHGP